MARSSDSNFLVAFFKDKTFQAREIRRVIALSFLYLGITTGLLGIFYYQLLGDLIDGMTPLLFVSEDAALVNEAVPALSAVLGRWLIAMLIVNAVVTLMVSLYVARRLGHPLLAIKRALHEVGDGNLDVRLRSSDNKDFAEITEALTAAMQTIRARIGHAKQGVEELSNLQQAREKSNEQSHTQAIDRALEHCRGALDYFQVDAAAKPGVQGNGNPSGQML